MNMDGREYRKYNANKAMYLNGKEFSIQTILASNWNFVFVRIDDNVITIKVIFNNLSILIYSDMRFSGYINLLVKPS